MPKAKTSRPSFDTLAKAQQARFRSTSTTIAEAARNPADHPWESHGYLLAVGHEDQNLFPDLRNPVGAKHFFASRGIKWWRSPQSGDSKGDGPTRNMTSSQVAAVNFMMPLARHEAALLAILQLFDPDVVDVLDLVYTPVGTNYGDVTAKVEFEWVGKDFTLEGTRYTRGAHVTSCDVFLVGVNSDGTRRAYLIEWKYKECYLPGRYLGGGDKGEERRRRYAKRYAAQDGCFTDSAPLNELLFDPIYQIMRLGLLGAELVRRREFGVTEARVVVVCPGENDAYRDRLTSPKLAVRVPGVRSLEDLVRPLWKDPRGIRITSQEELLRSIDAVQLSGIGEWREYQRERYGW